MKDSTRRLIASTKRGVTAHVPKGHPSRDRLARRIRRQRGKSFDRKAAEASVYARRIMRGK